jgi:hypothetical protein
MTSRITSYVLSVGDLSQAAKLVDLGDWNGFWKTLENSKCILTLPAPLGGIGLQVIDWLASERRLALTLRLEEWFWPKETSRLISGVGIAIHACMTSIDGRKFLRDISVITLEAQECAAIYGAYGPHDLSGAGSLAEIIAYLQHVSEAVAKSENDRLLILSYDG